MIIINMHQYKICNALLLYYKKGFKTFICAEAHNPSGTIFLIGPGKPLDGFQYGFTMMFLSYDPSRNIVYSNVGVETV